MRQFLKDYEPIVEIQKSGQKANIYEWQDKKGVNFRLVTHHQGGGTTAHSHLDGSEEIITFYSNRNLKEGEYFEFKNPALKEYPKAQNAPIEPKNPAALVRIKAAPTPAKMSDEELKLLQSELKQVLQDLPAQSLPKEINVDEFLKSLDNFENKENFIAHLQNKGDADARLKYLNLIEPTFKEPDFRFEKLENGILKEKRIKKFTDGKDFYYFLATKDKDKTLLTGFKTNKINTILKEFEDLDADIIQTFIRQGSKQEKSRLGLPENKLKTIIPQNQTQSQTMQVIQNLSIEEAKDELAKMSKTFGAHLNEAEKFKLTCLKMKLDDIQPELWRYLFDKDDAIKTLFEAKYRVSEELAPKEIKGLRADFEKAFSIQPIKDFGTNYAEFYRDGKGAIHKLLTEKRGQVAGAFYREDLGDITLAWGEAGTGKSDGWGLAKIAKFHPEIITDLPELIQTLPKVKDTANRIQLENENYKIAIRKDFEGKSENWVLTGYEKKESIARRRTDLPSSQSEAKKTTLADTQADIIPQKSEDLDKIASKKQGEKMLNNDLQRLFTSKKRLDYDKIKNYAKPNSMPRPNFKNYNEFRALFDNVKGNIGFVNTPYTSVKVKIYKAYEHFTKNTNNKNRENIKGGFFSTLTDPLFVIKSERVGQDESSVYFYKPFLSKDKSGEEKVMNIFSIAVDYNGNLDFKTYYHDDRNNRLKSVVNSVLQGKGEVVYIKSPSG